MKILHVAPSYYPATYWGGPIFSGYGLNNALARLPDVSLKILTTDSAGPSLSERLNQAELTGLYPNQEVFIARRVAMHSVSIELLWKLPSFVRWADVVHLSSVYSFPTIPTLAFCRIFKKPLVWSPRGAILDASVWEDSPRKLLKRIWEKLCNILVRPGRTVMHTTAEIERVASQERIPRAKSMIVPNGVETSDALPERTWVPDGNMRLMFIGRLSPKKGIENLLKAMSLLDDASVSLAIYGTGDIAYATKLKSLAEQIGLLGGAISFVGEVVGDSKTAAFLNADTCIVPSFTENFCMVVAEALAHGVPVVASRGTPWRQIEDKQCGFWVDNNPESLVRAISKIRSCNLAEMGRKGREWMKNEYSWDSIARSMHDVYKEAMGENT